MFRCRPVKSFQNHPVNQPVQEDFRSVRTRSHSFQHNVLLGITVGTDRVAATAETHFLPSLSVDCRESACSRSHWTVPLLLEFPLFSTIRKSSCFHCRTTSALVMLAPRSTNRELACATQLWLPQSGRASAPAAQSNRAARIAQVRSADEMPESRRTLTRRSSFTLDAHLSLDAHLYSDPQSTNRGELA